MRVFANELVKIKCSRAVRGVLITFVCLMLSVMLLGFGESVITEIEKNGFAAPFMWVLCNGPIGFFPYGVIVAGLIAGEFESGAVNRALSSGVRRGKYFLAKVTAVFIASVAVYGVSICLFTLVWSAKRGFDPQGRIFDDYMPKVFAYNGGMCIMILAYVALFCFFAYLFRAAVPTIAAAVVASLADGMGLFRGPVTMAMDSIRYFRKDMILTQEFAELLQPCVWMIVLFLALSYGLFVIRDVD